mmetsp:Transcript_20669/g.72990  ORF Transcript_20669/g.72990 Transcript_20669/m.72990 type:complete len:236 (+) Transcript_20669:229-936(+)
MPRFGANGWLSLLRRLARRPRRRLLRATMTVRRRRHLRRRPHGRSLNVRKHHPGPCTTQLMSTNARMRAVGRLADETRVGSRAYRGTRARWCRRFHQSVRAPTASTRQLQVRLRNRQVGLQRSVRPASPSSRGQRLLRKSTGTTRLLVRPARTLAPARIDPNQSGKSLREGGDDRDAQKGPMWSWIRGRGTASGNCSPRKRRRQREAEVAIGTGTLAIRSGDGVATTVAVAVGAA